MRIEWSEQALTDIQNITEYIFEHNPVSALEINDLIRNAVLILKKMPLAGRYGRISKALD